MAMGRRGEDPGRERIRARDAANPFAEGEQERRGMRPEVRKLWILGLVALVLVLLALVMPVGIFYSYSIYIKLSLSTFLARLTGNINALLSMFSGNWSAYESRFMLVVVCAVSGAALGLCGATYQGAFNNPLAAPKTLGVMGGGALGALVYVLWLQYLGPRLPTGAGTYTMSQLRGWYSTLGPLEYLWVQYGQCLCALVGCFLVVGIVVGLTGMIGRGRLTNVVVIIFGTVFSTAVTAIISFARYYFTSISSDAGEDMVTELRAIENYTMTGNYTFQDLLIFVLPILVCMAVVLLLRNRFTLLSFGDDEARAMGVNVNRLRYGMIAICTVMVALSISFCGHVAYLGFISGQLARRIVGPDFRYLLPASVFVGGGFLTLVQYICNAGLLPVPAYVDAGSMAGVVCSILGTLLFLAVVLVQRGRGGSGDWR